MPVVHPATLWQETGRWYKIGGELGRFKDKNERDMVLALTHEEVVTDLVRREIKSYRQLPAIVYHIQTKWRDDPRPRAGLIRAREFVMKDSYTLDRDEAGLDRQYRLHYQAYFNIFNRCALPTIAVESDVGMMGGTKAHEFMYLTPIGEDRLLLRQLRLQGQPGDRHLPQARQPPKSRCRSSAGDAGDDDDRRAGRVSGRAQITHGQSRLPGGEIQRRRRETGRFSCGRARRPWT